MNFDDTTYELIEQFLQGTLPEDHPFMQRIKDDSELALEVEVRSLLPDAVVDYRLMEVEKLIAGRKRKFIKQNSKNWNWALWSLPVILAGTVTYLYLSPSDLPKEIQKAEKETKENTLPQQRTPELIEPKPEIASDKTIKITKIKEEAKDEKVEPQNITLVFPDPTILTETPAVNPAPDQKTEQVAQKEIKPVLTNLCAGIHLKAFVEENRPCSGNSEGSLNIKEVKGGKAPYQFALNQIHFQEENKFTGLKEAEYDIKVKDANGCETIIYENYSLKSKSCIQFSDHVFNPTSGSWEVPNNHEKWGELAILDGNGNRIYIRNFEKGEKLNWGGISDSGTMLVPGMYIYSIKYTDGVVDQGRITITY